MPKNVPDPLAWSVRHNIAIDSIRQLLRLQIGEKAFGAVDACIMAANMAKLHRHGSRCDVAVESALTARGREPMTPNGLKVREGNCAVSSKPWWPDGQPGFFCF